MPIVSYVRRLRDILDRLRNNRLSIPRHQREFCWTPPQMRGLVDTVKSTLPMPAILVRELDDGSTSLEDGRQRLESIQRYVDGAYDGNDGRRFADLTEAEQTNFLNYEVVVVCYSGVDDTASRRIFNYYQGGRPLTVGERLWSVALTSPIVEFAITRLLTPGADLARRLAPVLGEHDPRTARAKDLTVAVALCAGLAHGINLLSKKWDDLESILPLDINEDLLTARLEVYARIWERVHRTEAVTTQTRRRKYWDLGNFGGYIAYSILLHGTDQAVDYDLPNTVDDLVEEWAEHIVTEYRLESPDRVPLLLRNMSKARSWKLARWKKGVETLFGRRAANPIAGGEETEDEEDEEDTE